MKKRVVSIILSLVLVFCAAAPALAADAIKVKIDGKEQSYDQMPVMENDRVLVPMRAIFEALGATVGWEESTQTVTGTLGSIVVVLKIGSQDATVSGNAVKLDVPAKTISDRTMVPVRFISEALGATVDWDDATQTVLITTKKDDAPPVTPTLPAIEADKKNFTFDNMTAIIDTVDYVRGANYPATGISLSSEQDHTTGSGKSVKLGGREKSDHRFKLNGVFTKDDIGKTFTISAWVYLPDKEGTISLATYSDTGTAFAYSPKKYISVEVPKAVWTELKFEYEHTDEIVTQVGIDQRPSSLALVEVIYLDDVTVVEGKFGNSNSVNSGEGKPIDPTTPTTPTTPSTPAPTNSQIVLNANGVIDSLNFDDLTGLVAEKDYQLGGSQDVKGIEVSSEQDHTSGSGKSLKIGNRKATHNRVKLMNFFSAADVGKTYTVKCWVYVPDADTSVRLGAYSATGTDFAMTAKAFSKALDVKKGTWTELTFEFKHEEAIVTLFGIDQGTSADLAATIYVDDISVTVK